MEGGTEEGWEGGRERGGLLIITEMQVGIPVGLEYRTYLLGKYPAEVLGEVRYGLNTLPNTTERSGTRSIPVPDASVSSVRTRVPVYHRPQYRGYGYFFGSASIPVLGTSVTSVRTRYRYPTLGYLWYKIDVCTRHFGKFGTTSTPGFDRSVSSVRPKCRYPILPVSSVRRKQKPRYRYTLRNVSLV